MRWTERRKKLYSTFIDSEKACDREVLGIHGVGGRMLYGIKHSVKRVQWWLE